MDEPLVEIDISLFANQIRVSPSNTLNLRQRIHDLPLAIDVSVEETQNVLNGIMSLYANSFIHGYALGIAGELQEGPET